MLSQVLQYIVQKNGDHFRYQTFIPLICWRLTKLCSFLSDQKCNTELVAIQLFHKYIIYRMELLPSHAIEIIIANNAEHTLSTLSRHMLKQLFSFLSLENKTCFILDILVSPVLFLSAISLGNITSQMFLHYYAQILILPNHY